MNAILNKNKNTNDKHESLTWLQIKEKEFFVEEDKQFVPVKSAVHNGLEDIRKKLRELMAENMNREEVARLKESEFYLDLDELDRLHKETDAKIAGMYYKLNF